GRTGEVNDELGSRIIATRIMQSLMRLCFLLEKSYAPYSKWFGTCFAKLSSATELVPVFHNALNAPTWKQREEFLCAAYEKVVEIQNEMRITLTPLPSKVRNFHERPYLVIGAGEIVVGTPFFGHRVSSCLVTCL
ncbi:DUF4037 domain-containing protein, partial [bacterium]|nr:DUF4037 domain-containing protein [bacterium]